MTTTSTETRNESYSLFSPKLGQRQREVYELLCQLGPLSNRHISDILKRPVNTVTGRVMELRQLGLVAEAGTVYDHGTARRVTAWRACDPEPVQAALL